VREENRGGRSIASARDFKPDLVLLDVMMPDMDGPSTLAELRSDPATSAIPVVIVSADATASRVEDLLASGADAFLTKPLDVKRFMAVMDDALSERVAA
jgi:CheY-like chemotaxis protein